MGTTALLSFEGGDADEATVLGEHLMNLMHIVRRQHEMGHCCFRMLSPLSYEIDDCAVLTGRRSPKSLLLQFHLHPHS